MNKTFNIIDINSYDEIIKEITKYIKKDMIISLKGTLGSGKTTFVQKLLDYFGYNGIINSPTFAIVNTHQIDNLIVNHIDAYRLNNYEDFLNDYINEDSLTIIEWFENLNLDNSYINLEIEFIVINSNHRKILLRSNDENIISNTSL